MRCRKLLQELELRGTRAADALHAQMMHRVGEQLLKRFSPPPPQYSPAVWRELLPLAGSV
jgi:hypothetical protein